MLNKLNNLNKFKYNNDNCNNRMKNNKNNKFMKTINILFSVILIFIFFLSPISFSAEYEKLQAGDEFQEININSYDNELFTSFTDNNLFQSNITEETRQKTLTERLQYNQADNPLLLYRFKNPTDDSVDINFILYSNEGSQNQYLKLYDDNHTLEAGESITYAVTPTFAGETMSAEIIVPQSFLENSSKYLEYNHNTFLKSEPSINDVMAKFVSVTIELIEINLSIWELLFYLIMFLMFTGFLLLIIIITWRIYDKATRDIYPHRRSGRNSNKDDDDF